MDSPVQIRGIVRGVQQVAPERGDMPEEYDTPPAAIAHSGQVQRELQNYELSWRCELRALLRNDKEVPLPPEQHSECRTMFKLCI